MAEESAYISDEQVWDFHRGEVSTPLELRLLNGVRVVAPGKARDGLAFYEENPRHRRAKLLRLTPRGHRTLREIQAAQRVWANALREEIGEADLRQASAILDRVLRAVY